MTVAPGAAVAEDPSWSHPPYIKQVWYHREDIQVGTGGGSRLPDSIIASLRYAPAT